jgi:hypothetical protein
MRSAVAVHDHAGASELLFGIALQRALVRPTRPPEPERYWAGALQTALAVEAFCSGFGSASREKQRQTHSEMTSRNDARSLR